MKRRKDQVITRCGCVESIGYDANGKCLGMKVRWLAPAFNDDEPTTEFDLSPGLVPKAERAQDNCLEVCIAYTLDEKGVATLMFFNTQAKNNECCPKPKKPKKFY
ncbi:MAG: hypothetical protein M3R69_01745 [Acidobacteriota bacterium]|nr:hypothetical protein [Acidobacteriota bacterium]